MASSSRAASMAKEHPPSLNLASGRDSLPVPASCLLTLGAQVQPQQSQRPQPSTCFHGPASHAASLTSFAQAARDVLIAASITLMAQRDCEQNAACDVISSCAHTDLHCPCRAAAAAAILRCSSLSSILPKIALACRALTQHHNTARTCAHTIPITTKADMQYSG